MLDVYGEVMGAGLLGTEKLGRIERRFWPRWRRIVAHVEGIWREPNDGIWETRGPRQHFTYSKVMAWVVFDRAVRLAQRFDLEAPLDRWRQIRDEIHHEACDKGVPGLLVIGLGLGVMLTPSVNVVKSAFPEARQGEISGLSRSVSNLGSSLGTAIAGTILVADLASANKNTPYVLAMAALAALALVGLAAALLLPANPGATAARQ